MTNDQLINQNSGKTEYGTPLEILERASNTMGGIDLDPASSAKFNKFVGAVRYRDKNHDGLKVKWYGNVWMNHPYGRGEIACKKNCKKVKCDPRFSRAKSGILYEYGKTEIVPQDWRGHCITEDIPGNADWINKLVSEYESGNVQAALCITFASTGEKWFRPLLMYPQCFLYDRIKFLDEKGVPSKGNSTKSSVITYLGPKSYVFWLNFIEIGVVKKMFAK